MLIIHVIHPFILAIGAKHKYGFIKIFCTDARSNLINESLIGLNQAIGRRAEKITLLVKDTAIKIQGNNIHTRTRTNHLGTTIRLLLFGQEYSIVTARARRSRTIANLCQFSYDRRLFIASIQVEFSCQNN
jgi:hypothetical protein